MHHVYYNFEYLGVNYNKPPFPKSFPYVMTLLTVPTTTILLAVGGFFAWARDVRNDRSIGKCGLGTLVVLNASAPMLVLTLTGAPIFGGDEALPRVDPVLRVARGVRDRSARARASAPRDRVADRVRAAQRDRHVSLASVRSRTTSRSRAVRRAARRSA